MPELKDIIESLFIQIYNDCVIFLQIPLIAARKQAARSGARAVSGSHYFETTRRLSGREARQTPVSLLLGGSGRSLEVPMWSRSTLMTLLLE